jgi:hypothetical protein
MLTIPFPVFSQYDYFHNSNFENARTYGAEINMRPNPERYISAASEGLKGKVKTVMSYNYLQSDTIISALKDLRTRLLVNPMAYHRESRYDSSGNLLSTLLFSAGDRPGHIMTEFKEYTYDTAGNLLTSYRQNCNNSQFGDTQLCDVYKSNFSYDKMNNLVSEISWMDNKYTGNKYVKFQHKKYSYDEMNRLEKIKTRQRIREDERMPRKIFNFRPAQKEVFFIHKKDSTITSRLKVKKQFRSSSLRKTGERKVKYTYNTAGKLIESDDGLFTKNYWKYNEIGQLIETNANVNTISYYFIYDENGNTIMVGPAAYPATVYITYENYDANGNWLRSISSSTKQITVREIEYY